MQVHFIPPTPESPLPREHRYKLRMRCSNCLTDTYPVACMGVRRLSTVEVSRRVLEFAERIERPCPTCESITYRLISFFPDRSEDQNYVSHS